jgi:hypothetical protein
MIFNATTDRHLWACYIMLMQQLTDICEPVKWFLMQQLTDICELVKWFLMQQLTGIYELVKWYRCNNWPTSVSLLNDIEATTGRHLWACYIMLMQQLTDICEPVKWFLMQQLTGIYELVKWYRCNNWQTSLLACYMVFLTDICEHVKCC